MNILKPTNYFKLTAAVLAFFSIGLLLVPRIFMHLLSITVSSNGAMFMQFLGASLAGHAYLNWHTRSAATEVMKPVMRMNIFALFSAVLIGLAAIITGGYTLIGLLILIMHAVFLCGFFLVLKSMK